MDVLSAGVGNSRPSSAVLPFFVCGQPDPSGVLQGSSSLIWLMQSTTPLLMTDQRSALLQDSSGEVLWTEGVAGKPSCSLTLSPGSLVIRPCSPGYATFDVEQQQSSGHHDSRTLVVPLSDVVGTSADTATRTLHVYRYPVQTGCCAVKGQRGPAHLSFQFPTAEVASSWAAQLTYVLRDVLPGPSVGAAERQAPGASPSTASDAPAAQPLALGAAPVALSRRKFLIFVNPVSGRGLGLGVWRSVEGIFAEAGIETTVVTTTRAGHCREYLLALDARVLLSYACLVLVGGDGLVFEAVNGIMARDGATDATTAKGGGGGGGGGGAQGVSGGELLRRLPLAHVGAGTGNGLCKSALFESREEYR